MSITFERDNEFALNGNSFVIERVLRGTNQVRACNKNTGEEFLWSFGELSSKFEKGELQFSKLLPANDESDEERTDRKVLLLTTKERELIAYRKGYIMVITNSRGQLISGTKEMNKALANHALERKEFEDRPSISTVRRWFARYRASGNNPLSLLGRYKNTRVKKGKRALVKELFEACADQYYLKQEKSALNDTHDRMKERIELDPEYAGVKLPHLSTLYRWVGEMSEFQKHKKRKGYLDANRHYPSGAVKEEPTYLLESVELDHTQLDINIIDSDSGTVLGRPWMTAFIDRKSRMIIGFYVSINQPGAIEVIEAFKNAILSKDYVKEIYGDCIKTPWPCMGLMDQVITDNGAELHSERVQNLSVEYIDLQYNPKGTPQNKGMIERFFRTINEGLCHGLEGTTFSNYVKCGDYDSQGKACLTMEDLVKIIHIWIIEIYHKKFHRGINNTPLDCWKENEADFVVRLPPAIEKINELAWKRVNRTIQKSGIELDGLYYKSPQLMKLARQHGIGVKVDLLIDESDIRVIRVIIPETSESINVPCTTSAYASRPVSVTEHKAVKKSLKERNIKIKELNTNSIRESKRLIEATLEGAKKSKKKRKNKSDLKKNQQDSSAITNTKTQSLSESATLELSLTKYEESSLFDSVDLLEGKIMILNINAENAANKIHETVIKHRDYSLAYKKIMEHYHRSEAFSRPFGLTVTGCTGSGKSTLIENIIEDQVANEIWTPTLTIKPVIVIEVSANPDNKGIYLMILDALSTKPPKAKPTERELRELAIGSLITANTKLIIADEVQHFVEKGVKTSPAMVADCFKGIMNRAKVSIVFFGLPKMHKLLDSNSQLKRRFSEEIDLNGWTVDSERDRTEFCSLIKTLIARSGYEIDVKALSDNDLIYSIFYATNGTIANLVKLVAEAVRLMLIDGEKVITTKYFEHAFKIKIWSKVDSVRNPFSKHFNNEPLIKNGECYAEEVA